MIWYITTSANARWSRGNRKEEKTVSNGGGIRLRCFQQSGKTSTQVHISVILSTQTALVLRGVLTLYDRLWPTRS